MNRQEWMATGLGVLLLAATASTDKTCASAWFDYGLELGRCPSGKVRQSARIDVGGLRRGATAQVTVTAAAHFTLDGAEAVKTVPVTRFESIALTLVDARGTATEIPAGWVAAGDAMRGSFEVPDVPDGDYQLRARYVTRTGAGELDVPVPLYTPARIHVITDRPLYEPGNLVHFRAVALRARDLGPLDGRPGTWIVRNPENEVLLEEKAPAGDWGIVAGSFPLDKAAPTGTWHVQWVSAGATDDVAFTVEPFRLPRFRVDSHADKPFYQPGEAPVVRGAVLYSSGAPVTGAKLEIEWQIAGAWPPPLDWEAKLLPKQAVTGANGRFELALPVVPNDLQGLVTMTAQISAVDPAGDRVAGAASVLLSKDGITVSSVTELGDGLVQGFNNRLYLRVTTPDGRALANTKISVKRAWQATDNGVEAEVDEDGVASLQLDPGAPVNIVIPAVPYRPAPKAQLVSREEPNELIGGQGAPLADQVEMDRWLAALAPCAKWVDEASEGTRIGFRVDSAGTIVATGAGPTPLDRCVSSVIALQRLPGGADRMYALTFHFADPELPKLGATIETAIETPAGLEEAIQELARATRGCLPGDAGEGELPRQLAWRARAGSRDVELGTWIKDPNASEANAAIGCVMSHFGGAVHLKEPATSDAIGLVRFTLEQPERVHAERPQPTMMLGYELIVSAEIDGKPSTKLRVTPGQIPNLRMRVTPVLAKPGDTITAELIRGPEFTGDLPKELLLTCLRSHDKAPLDPDHKAKLVLDKATDGWCEVSGGGVRGLVFVRPQGELAVTVKAKDRYAPGDQAQLEIQTTIGGRGGPAAVGLFGVDDSLGQLVPLPGANDMGRVQPVVGTSTPAFGVLDGQALTLGHIRGANAAAATVLRVTSIPTPPELDAVVSAHAESHFDASEELTDHFYIVLAELHVQARRWEAQAPASEKMRPATMAALWRKAITACEQRGQDVGDAYGRTLRLSQLPSDLLALTDPRAVVVVATRLPEDIENWAAWVAKERP